MIRTIPVAMGLKRGSWKAIRKYHGTIETLPVHLRSDDKLIRYLIPAMGSNLSNKQMLRASCILFPQYVEGGHVQLNPLSAVEGLCRLTSAGYDVPGGLNPISVEHLVEWIAKVPCYEITFDHLDKAVAAARTLLP
jgi:hypothetical protein